MTGAGAPGGPGIIKAIQADPRFQLLVADKDLLAAGRFMDVEFAHIPGANDPLFIESILDLCTRRNIQVLFPLVTLELPRLAEAKERFRHHGIEIIVSDQKSLEIANNKAQLLTHLQNLGIPTPNFRIARKVSEIQLACAELGYPNNPVVVKPSISNGSRGVRILDKNQDAFKLLFEEKPGHLYSDLESIIDAIDDRSMPEMIVSEYLPGEEFTVDALVKGGKAELIIPRKRIKMIGGITVKGQFLENREIIQYVEAIISSLNLNGPIGFQVKADREGKFKILEINPRIQGTSVAAIGAGVNLPVLAICNALGIPHSTPIQIKWGMGFVRYYSELFFDYFNSIDE